MFASFKQDAMSHVIAMKTNRIFTRVAAFAAQKHSRPLTGSCRNSRLVPYSCFPDWPDRFENRRFRHNEVSDTCNERQQGLLSMFVRLS